MSTLVLNAGSSSLKFGLYDYTREYPRCLARGSFADLDGESTFRAFDDKNHPLNNEHVNVANQEQTITWLLEWLAKTLPGISVQAVGHRVVHGGSLFSSPVRLTATVLKQLYAFVPLAPLHLSHNLAVIRALQSQQPNLPQVACFDTAFHHNMPFIEQVYALPRHWFDKGIRRYGFHGLSYEYIAGVLPDHLGSMAEGKVIVAHLGHGASLCAMHQRRSVATTMGFTPLDGIPMATRPGSLDPGIITYLMREEKIAVNDLDHMLNHECGLAGLSNSSGDMRELLADSKPESREAVEYFVHHTHRAIASLAGALGGLDALIFTAGIGENSSTVRESICKATNWMGVEIDVHANKQHKTLISKPDSRISVWVIPTDEEQIIARHVYSVLRSKVP